MPTITDLTLPLLRLAANGEVSYEQAAEALAPRFQLTPDELAETVPTGTQTRFTNRIRWAKVELGMAQLVENTRKKHFRATSAGMEVLKSNPIRVDRPFLMGFPAYRAKLEARQGTGTENNAESPESRAVATVSVEYPHERVYGAVREIDASLSEELLQRLLAGSPAFFERVILDLLLKMNYGGARGAGRHLGGTNDGGVDGVIDQDALGLDSIYIQAKRYGPTTGPVGRPEIQAFVGSLVGRAASKGVFVTTGRFAASAREYAAAVPYRLVLIDGTQLTSLLVQYGIGVRTEQTVELKRIDEDYFDTMI
jgi:restriction system protein